MKKIFSFFLSNFYAFMMCVLLCLIGFTDNSKVIAKNMNNFDTLLNEESRYGYVKFDLGGLKEESYDNLEALLFLSNNGESNNIYFTLKNEDSDKVMTNLSNFSLKKDRDALLGMVPISPSKSNLFIIPKYSLSRLSLSATHDIMTEDLPQLIVETEYQYYKNLYISNLVLFLAVLLAAVILSTAPLVKIYDDKDESKDNKFILVTRKDVY
jgi:hypothetical protein